MHYDHIAIEGNIGSGKTTLAEKVAEQYEAGLVLESFADNPFLPKFYEEPERYAFSLELFFLAERFHQLKDIADGRDLFRPLTISDYFIQKSLIFAGNTLEREEFELFRRLFDIMYGQLPKPDLILFLHKNVEKLQENIMKRGRPYERNIPNEYLNRVEKGYFEFFRQHPELRVVVVESNDLDFVESERDLEVVQEILREEYPKGTHFIQKELLR